MKPLKLTVFLSCMFLVTAIELAAQKQTFAAEPAAQELDAKASSSKFAFRPESKTPHVKQPEKTLQKSRSKAAVTLKLDEAKKIAREMVVGADGTIILYARYGYDSEGRLIERAKYTYDNRANMTGYVFEILNDGSEYWMQWAPKWIVERQVTRKFDGRDNLLEYRNSNLDYSYGDLVLFNYYSRMVDAADREVYYESYYREDFRSSLMGESKYYRKYDSRGNTVYYESYMWNGDMMDWQGNYKELSEYDDQGNTSLYEYYIWSTEMKNWVGDFKYTSSYTYTGDLTKDVTFYWNWDNSARKFVIDLTEKEEYLYQLIGNVSYTIKFEQFELQNNEYVLMSETTRVPYPQGRSYASVLVRYRENNVMENYTKTEYSYNVNHVWTQILYFVWHNEAWGNYQKRIFDYTVPDSIRTETSYLTQIYFDYTGNTPPNQCTGVTDFPRYRYVTKSHPVSGYYEIDYSFTWNASTCQWNPSSSKTIRTLDAQGTRVLTELYCSDYNETDWYNCTYDEYFYNDNWQVTEYRNSFNGTLSYREVATYDANGNEISWKVYYGETLGYQYDSEYNAKNRLIRQVYTYYNSYLPFGKERYKWDITYLADTLRTEVREYTNVDLNGDAQLADDEWRFDYRMVYTYDPPLSGDSIHLVMSELDDLENIRFGAIRLLKISGELTNSQLNYIVRECRDSLRVLNLEDAVLDDNTLRSGTLEDLYVKKLILPSSLVALEEGAIGGDYQYYLEELVMFPSLTEIEPNLVLYILSVKRLELSTWQFEKLYSIEEFMDGRLPGILDVYKSGIEKITFNDPWGKMPEELCYNLSYLREVIFKDGLTEIGANAFKSCGMLRTVRLPATLTKIGYNAFWGCNELTELIIPEGTEDIGHSAFWGCSGVTQVGMPASLKTIGRNAFWGCTAIEQMQVNASTPPALGASVFAGVPRDAQLTVPAGSIELYMATDQWRDFIKIISGFDDETAGELLFTVAGRQLMFRNLPVNTPIQIYTLSGLKIFDLPAPDQFVTIDLEPGMYVVKLGTEVRKVSVH